MNVLSLFDGMSCGQQALQRAGIKVDNYFASEIDKHAIKVTMHNYPNTIQLGSVTEVDGHKLPKIDLLIGGSPCQSFSFAGKRKGMSTKDEQEILTLNHYLQLKAEGYEFEGQSYLFWEYMRLLNEVKPTYFLLENVMMGEKWERVLSKAIGVNPIEINSALVSAQNRRRLYWFGQIRERLFFNDNYCYICSNEKENRGIQTKSQNKRGTTVLGEKQRQQRCLQGLSNGVFEDKQKGDYQDLFNNLPENKQKNFGPEPVQGKEKSLPRIVSEKEQRENIAISETISPNTKGERYSQNDGEKSNEANCKEDEDSLTQRIWTKEQADKRRIDYNFKYGQSVCCVQCGKKLDHRPYNSIVSWRDKQNIKSPSTLSEVQFNEARQNNGRVFDLLEIGVKGLDSLFGETILPIPQPKDRGVLLKDILESEVDEKYYLSEKMIARINRSNNSDKCFNSNDKSLCLAAGYYKQGRDNQYITVHNTMPRSSTTGRGGTGPLSRTDGKTYCLDTGSTNAIEFASIKFGRTDEAKQIRKENMAKGIDSTPFQAKEITRLDFEKMGTLTTMPNKDNLVSSIMLGRSKNWGTLESDKGKHYTLCKEQPHGVRLNNRIRRLTPIECERLQTVKDNYTAVVSDSQRYKMLGNGWTVDVIAHIFKYIEL